VLLVGALSKFADFFYCFPGSLDVLSKVNIIMNQLQVIADGLLGTLISGQESLNIISNNLHITLTKQVALGNVKLSIPLSLMENNYGRGFFNSIEFSDEVVKNLDSGSGYLPLMFMKFIKNPYYLNSSKLRSAVFLLHSNAVNVTDVKSLSAVDYYIVIQFSETQDFNFGINIDKVITNLTFPELSIMNDNSSTPWKGCKVSSYNNYNVSFACDSIYDLRSSSTRKLSNLRSTSDSSNSVSFGVKLTSHFPISPTVQAVGFIVDSKYPKIVLLLLISLAVVFLVGYSFFYRWDLIDQVVIRRKVTKKQKHSDAISKTSKESICDSASSNSCNIWCMPLMSKSRSAAAVDDLDFNDIYTEKNTTISFMNNPLSAKLSLHDDPNFCDLYTSTKETNQSIMKFIRNPLRLHNVSLEERSEENKDNYESDSSELVFDYGVHFSNLSQLSTSILLSHDKLRQSSSSLGKATSNSYFNCVLDLLDSAFPVDEWFFQDSIGFLSNMRNIFHLIIRHHEYLNMFYDPSLQNTRTMRWIRVVFRVMIFLFVTTVFYGFFYSDDGSCQSHETEHYCLSETKILFNGHQCAWKLTQKDLSTDLISHTCSLDVPIISIVYIMIVVTITLTISIPIILFYQAILNHFCARKVNFRSWFGYAQVAVETQNETDSSRNAMNSPDVEAELLMNDVMSVLTDYSDINSSSRKFKRAKIEAILKWIGINIDGSPIPLGFIDWIQYGNQKAKLVAKIKSVRNRAAMIKTALENDCNTEKSKEIMLMQFFILEQFTRMKQYVLSRLFFTFPLINPSLISPVSWTCAWSVIVLSIAFFFYWILKWGLSQGGATFWLWILNFGICLSLDIFIVQSIYAYAIFVLLMKSIISQLKQVRQVFSSIALESKQIVTVSTEASSIKIFHYLSPVYQYMSQATLRNSSPLNTLYKIDDDEISHCREDFSVTMGILAWSTLGLPLMIGFYSQTVGDVTLEMILSCTPPMLIIGSFYLYSLIGMMLLAPLGFILFYFVWILSIDNLSRNTMQYRSVHILADKNNLNYWTTSRRQLNKISLSKDTMLFFIYYATRPIKLSK